DTDTCRDLSPGRSCASADPCVTGACDPVAGCTVAPIACNAPPPSSCVGPSLLRVYDATGVCTAGTCGYGFQLVPCPSCPTCDDGNACTSNDACSSGTCAGQPVACSSPPPPHCAGGTLRRFSSPGTCMGGTCQYPHSDTPCPSGCDAAGTDCASGSSPDGGSG